MQTVNPLIHDCDIYDCGAKNQLLGLWLDVPSVTTSIRTFNKLAQVI